MIGRARDSAQPEIEHRRVRVLFASRTLLATAVIAAVVLILALAWHFSTGTAVMIPSRPSPLPTVNTSAPGELAESVAQGSDLPQSSEGNPSVAPGIGPGGNNTSGRVVVYVTGKVSAPGIYALGPAARVADAIEAAGGLTATADQTAQNLARILTDGEHIHIPAPGETLPPGLVGPAPASAGGADNNAGSSSPGDDAKNGTGTGARGGRAPGKGSGRPININTASSAQLQQITGIGPALAQRIVEHRKANGPFTSVAALDDVSGIGPSLLGRIRDSVTVK